MKIFNYLKKIAVRACCITVPATLFIFLIGMGMESAFLSFEKYMCMFLFGLLMAFSFEWFGIRSLHIGIRILLNVISCNFAFLLSFSLAGNFALTGSNIAIFGFLVTLIYGVVAGLTFPLLVYTGYYKNRLSQINPHENVKEDTPYQNRFQ